MDFQLNQEQGERVECVAKVHWAYVVPALLQWVVFSLFFWFLITRLGLVAVSGWWWGILVAPALLPVQAVLVMLTTKGWVTSHRVLGVTGILSKHAVELLREQVESVEVRQPLVGRVFGFGSVVIRGTGGSGVSLPGIVNPFGFRDSIQRRPGL